MFRRQETKLPSARSARAIVGIAVLLVLVALGAETTRTLRNEYVNEVEELLSNSDRTAQKLATRTTEVFDRVNQTTRLIEFWQKRGDAPQLQTLRVAGVIPQDVIQFVYTTDARGFVIDTTDFVGALNVADETFFKYHRLSPSLDYYLGPVWVNAVDKSWGIPMTRRLDGAGAFQGMIVAMVNPAALSVVYAQTESKGTAVGILGADGIFRSRSLDGKLSFGERGDPGRLMERAGDVRKDHLPFVSPLDGIPRFVSATKVEGYPLFAVVAVDAEEALSSYRRTRHQVLVWAAVVAAATLLAGWLSLVQANRLDASSRRSRRSEADFRATLEGSMDAVMLLQAVRNGRGELVDMSVRDCNALAAQMLTTTPERMRGCLLSAVLPSVGKTGGLKYFETVMKAQRPGQAEIESTEPILMGRWFHHQLVPLDDGIAFISRDVTERKKNEKALAALARTDALTGLPNRRDFDEFAVAARARALRCGATLALFFIDLDGFKNINDRHGHAVGDAVLIEVATRLRETFRETDLVARLGGDEFAVIAEGAGTLQEVQDVCSRVIATLERAHRVDGVHETATASVGVAVFDGVESSQSLCCRADEAMYRAKSAGKGIYRVAADSEVIARGVDAASGVKPRHKFHPPPP